VCAVLGAQWGDEGKGKLVDVLAQRYDIIARYNGGSNAGHTLVVNGKKFAFHLLPCGMLYEGKSNVIGNGVVVHVPTLLKELDSLRAGGVDPTGRLKISDRAHLLFDFHQVSHDGYYPASSSELMLITDIDRPRWFAPRVYMSVPAILYCICTSDGTCQSITLLALMLLLLLAVSGGGWRAGEGAQGSEHRHHQERHVVRLFVAVQLLQRPRAA